MKGQTMNRLQRNSGLCLRLTAGLLFLMLAPALANAEALQFRNDTPVPVVVQAACVVNGRLVRDRPYLLSPSDKTPAITLPGNKVITISEAKVPNRVLFQGVVPAGTEDQLFGVEVDGTHLKLEKQRPKRP
jgi:hypothetical protein